MARASACFITLNKLTPMDQRRLGTVLLLLAAFGPGLSAGPGRRWLSCRLSVPGPDLSRTTYTVASGR